MDPKLDCQKLRYCLSEYFFVDSSLFTNIMSQNHLKMEHSEIGNRCYGYRILCKRCHLQGETPSEVSFTSTHDLWTFRVGMRCNIDNLRLCERISGHKTRVNNTVDLYNYLRFYDNVICTASRNKNFRLTEATRMDAHGFVMLNDGNFALFRTMGVLWVHMGSKWRIGDFVVTVILEIKITISLAC